MARDRPPWTRTGIRFRGWDALEVFFAIWRGAILAKSKRDRVEERNKALWDLLCARMEEDVPLDELLAALKQKLPGEPKITPGHLARVLREMAGRAPDHLSGASLTVGGSIVRLEPSREHVQVQRRLVRHQTKERLGKLLWHQLLGTELPDGWAACPAGYGDDALGRQIADLRRGMMLGLYFDGGSTTETIVDQYDPSSRLRGATEEHRRQTPRLEIVTTSLPIANILCKKSLHHNVRPLFVGGQISPDYRCVSGLITQRCLPQFAMSGAVAVLGATGYLPDGRPGGPALLCDSLEEAIIKESLMNMAELKIVVMDSEKILNPSPRRIFTALGAVDLILVDDGTDETNNKNLPTTVQEFCLTAKREGVVVVVLTRTRRK
jgi:DeoR/GlpR family transcriptional regulator of sugar metabolism